MWLAIFIAGSIIEAVFGIFCVVHKSGLKKAKSVMRLAEVACFILLFVLSIIEWSFRYYALALLLAVLSLIGLLRLFMKPKPKSPYRAWKTILSAAGFIVLLFLAALPAIIFPQFKPIATTGAYQVETAAYTYSDNSRVETYTDTGEFRKLNAQFWYPEDAEGCWPLIVFSHGGNGIKTSNASLFSELASHGYVVCSIDHPYHSLFTTDTSGKTTLIDMGYMKELQAEDAKADRQQSFDYYQKWMALRTEDINFVIDTVISEAVNGNPDTVYQCTDTSKIGVAGHSLGGSAALGIGRTRQDIGAVLALESPFLCDITGVENGEFVLTPDAYPAPILSIYSDSAWAHLADWPQYAANDALLSSTNETVFNVHIVGAGHFTLTDLALASPFFTRMFNGIQTPTNTEYCLKTINELSLAFFDCYLKGTGTFTPAQSY